MIDPLHSLAFSIQANPGVYAVLVGSGISRAAQIPTGWEITLDLVRKLANLSDETCKDPAQWYREEFGKEADYSELLDGLAKSQTERQQLLRPYLEPTEQEREEGAKQPTAAHRAIAALAAQGFIKVILTTNFDQLMETALREEGVQPTILSSDDDIEGALPLIHTGCCVFKVHGDYLDTRIRNTQAELDEYSDQSNQLLDRIFDEFGLIVCGWSAEWDGALRCAMTRAPSRRFTTYWATRGEPGDRAQRLIEQRGAQVIHIEDANTFFQTVQQHVESIEQFSQPHPLSTEAAVASLKRYISDPRHRIRLADLVDNTVGQIVEITSGEDFDMGSPQPTREAVADRVAAYEAACLTLLAMASVGGYWAEEEHVPMWQQALRRLSSIRPYTSLYDRWLWLQPYPTLLLLCALGLGAVEAGRLQFLRRISATELSPGYPQETFAVRELALPHGRVSWDLMQGLEPPNDRIQNALRPHAERIALEGDRYTFVFEKLDILIALNIAYHQGTVESQRRHWNSLEFLRYHRSEPRKRVIQEIEESLTTMGDASPFVTCNLFGETKERCLEGVVALKELMPVRW